MEEIKENKILNVLKWIFVIVTLIHIIYATVTMRGMYMDGSFFMVDILNKCSNHIYNVTYFPAHTKFLMYVVLQLPVILSQFVIKNKFALMMIFSFVQFAIPVLALWFNYRLTKRTGRYDVLFWNLFCYGVIILLYMISSVGAPIIGVTLLFILLNYLVAKIDYNKKDIISILILILSMFFAGEYIAYLGLLIFFCHYFYVINEKSKTNETIKMLIGYGSLLAAIYNIILLCKKTDENIEMTRCIKDIFSVFPHLLEFNSLIFVFTIILLLLIVFKKTNLGKNSIILITLGYVMLFIRLITTLNTSLWPMWEAHFTSFIYIVLPIIFLGIFFKDFLNKNSEVNYIRYSNCICVVLFCSVFLTMWQIVDTYFWNENIKFMQFELDEEEQPLYIPSLHDEEISSFGNSELRRYIWHGNYALLSILFSKDYEQKTLLVNYDKTQNDDNLTFRNKLYVNPNKKNSISVPYGIFIDIKNKYWDLTKCAQALDKYNKENNIQTDY